MADIFLPLDGGGKVGVKGTCPGNLPLRTHFSLQHTVSQPFGYPVLQHGVCSGLTLSAVEGSMKGGLSFSLPSGK
jgi:hypothetical protein